MTVLALSGSTRRGSLNTALASAAARAAERLGHDALVVADLDRLPFFSSELEALGDPAPVAELRAAAARADLIVLATPEYNGTVSGVLLNAIEWLSRPPGRSVLRDRRALVLSASPGPGAGARAATHLEAVLSHIGADVAGRLSVPKAYGRLPEGRPDAALAAEIDGVVRRLLPVTAQVA